MITFQGEPIQQTIEGQGTVSHHVSDCGRYRVTWWNTAPPTNHCFCYRSVPTNNGVFWDLLTRRATREAGYEACQAADLPADVIDRIYPVDVSP